MPFGVAGVARGAADPGEPDLAEAAAQQVGAVGWALHPGLDHAGRRAEAARAPDEVLAHEPGARAPRVAGGRDAVDEGAAGGGGVGEEPVPDHVVRVPGGGLGELGVRAHRADAGRGAALVDQAEDALLERRGALPGGVRLGARAARRRGAGAWASAHAVTIASAVKIRPRVGHCSPHRPLPAALDLSPGAWTRVLGGAVSPLDGCSAAVAEADGADRGMRSPLRLWCPVLESAAWRARHRSIRSPPPSAPAASSASGSSGVALCSGGADSAALLAGLVGGLRARSRAGAAPQLRAAPRLRRGRAQLPGALRAARGRAGGRAAPAAGRGQPPGPRPRGALRGRRGAARATGAWTGSRAGTPAPTWPRPSSTGSRPRRAAAPCSGWRPAAGS